MPSLARQNIPSHLKKYIVDQNYEKYTPEDQAVWRYILRQLKDFLSLHAHSAYVEGLKKTGIRIESIPKIDEMDEKLAEFGWGAVPVSGFIPPAAFMEFQSLGILPIASEMRSIDHLLYTPAPDIVHEAAGHAPILIDPQFASYLKKYAAVARNAIISKEDLKQYEAIRVLSDIKENPSSTAEEIKIAEDELVRVNQEMSFVSEAAILSRMNWWTAEYGLIGSLEKPQIFGAGLLSSAGEARSCLSAKVKKLPLTLSCIEQSYDITEPQPQLYVTPNFLRLHEVLDEMEQSLSFRKGGLHGLDQALKADSVNSIELDSGLQISGVLERYDCFDGPRGKEVYFLKLKGPCQLSHQRSQLPGHGPALHSSGFSSPLGRLKNSKIDLCRLKAQDLASAGLIQGQKCVLEFESGVRVEGLLKNSFFLEGKLGLLTWDQSRVTLNEKVLFDPSWGQFDMAIGESVSSVFGGPADREAFGEADDFVAQQISKKSYSASKLKEFELLQNIRDLREGRLRDGRPVENWKTLYKKYRQDFSKHWLMGLELYELSFQFTELKSDGLQLKTHLEALIEEFPQSRECISDGIRLADIVL